VLTDTRPLLEVEEVSKTFPGVKALDRMRLSLRHGEVLALVGENGAGKSTLMKLLSGIHRPDTGRFFLDGAPLRPTGPRHAQEMGIGIIHQEFNLLPDLTVAQNIFIGREPRRAGFLLDRRALDARARELIGRLGLPLDPHRRVGGLTVAQQQMVEIAKALSHDPRVLIMDEPTAALNDAEVRTLHQLIRRFVRPETGVIYISHRMAELTSLCDRITVIRDGQYVATMETAQTRVRDVIAKMVGREIGTGTRPRPAPAAREPLLTVSGLSTRTLLRDVGFALYPGEILGFAGLMGAGRTEVARALIGADPVTSGTVTLRGRPVRIRNPADAARLRIGYLSEDRKRLGLLPEDGVDTNIALGALRERFARFGFVRDRAVGERAAELVSALHVATPSLDRPVRHLSGGNQQKVVLAKWLAKDCDVLVFDEPTRGIDVAAKEEIYRLLDTLAQQGKALVMISSDLPEVLRMAHRVLVMAEGHITAELTAAEATQENVMHYATLRPGRPGTRPAPSPASDPAGTPEAGTR